MRPLLILTQMFPPEVGAAANRMQRLAQFAKEKGYEVDVVSWFPHYPQRRLYSGYRGWFRRDHSDGIQVRRFRPWIPKPTMARRMLAEAWLAAGAVLLGLSGRRPKAVFATTPSPLLAVSGWVVAFLRRAPFLLEVRDLTWRYPAGVAGRDLNKVERFVEQVILWVARRAALVVTTTPEQAAFFTGNGLNPSRVYVMPNGVSAADLAVQIPHAAPDGAFTVMYTGLVGLPQGLEVLVKAASLLRDQPVRFEIVGEGVEKSRLQAMCAELGLTRVTFVPAVPRGQLHHFFARADVLFAHLRGASAFETALPSKILEYMATGRPVLFGGRGVGARLVEEAGAGLVIPPDDPAALAAGIITLLDNPEMVRSMGANGRACVASRFNTDRLLEKLFATVDSLVGG